MMRRAWLGAGLLICILGLSLIPTADGSNRLSVFVSIVPQEYFVKKIGGEFVEVSVMVKPGANPATYEPRPRQMVGISRAKVYFAIGVPFENVWLKRLISANRRMLVVHTEEGIEKRTMKVSGQLGKRKEGSRGRGLEHEAAEGDHPGIKDPHVWLSPPLVKIMAKNILSGLLAVDATHGTLYKANYRDFMKEIDLLDQEMRQIFAGKGEKVQFMVFHPAWGYFADTYGLEQVAIEIEGKEPKPAELRRVIHRGRERGIKVVFVQPGFSTRSARTIARAIGGKIAFANPLAADWERNLKEVAGKFRAALR